MIPGLRDQAARHASVQDRLTAQTQDPASRIVHPPANRQHGWLLIFFQGIFPAEAGESREIAVGTVKFRLIFSGERRQLSVGGQISARSEVL